MLLNATLSDAHSSITHHVLVILLLHVAKHLRLIQVGISRCIRRLFAWLLQQLLLYMCRI